MLLDAARSSGARIMTGAEVVNVEPRVNELEGRQIVVLNDSRQIDADVVIGADGTLGRGYCNPSQNARLNISDRALVKHARIRAGSAYATGRDRRFSISRNVYPRATQTLPRPNNRCSDREVKRPGLAGSRSTCRFLSIEEQNRVQSGTPVSFALHKLSGLY